MIMIYFTNKGLW